MKHKSIRVAALFGIMLMCWNSVRAAELPRPEGEVLLTVTGEIGVTNEGDSAVFDLDMLRSLPTTTFSTTTIWTRGVSEYTGVSLYDLLEALVADGANIHAVALNEYAVDIPASDAVEGGPIIAYEMDGKTMRIRDKGPLWIIYPFDDVPEYKSEVVYSRSIWQLKRLEIR